MFYSLNQFQPRNPRLMSQEDIQEEKQAIKFCQRSNCCLKSLAMAKIMPNAISAGLVHGQNYAKCNLSGPCTWTNLSQMQF